MAGHARRRVDLRRSCALSGIAGPGEHGIEFGSDHRLDEAPHLLTQAGLERMIPEPLLDDLRALHMAMR